MKAFVLGASGQVGGALFERLLGLYGPTQVVGSYCRNGAENLVKVDLAGLDLAPLISAAPSHVYLPASYTNVDGCELDPQSSYQINVLGVKAVVEACRLIGARLIYFSSDYVFDGSAGPYGEADAIAPLCVYGRHKAEAEALCLHDLDSVVVRTTVVYGPERQGKNFVCRLIKSLEAGTVVKVPDDQLGNPTFNENLAEAAVELGVSSNNGIFNLVGPERCSRYEFAQEAARVFGLPLNLIQPVSTASLQQVARRPLAGGLKVEKAKSALGTELIGYKAGLQLFKARFSQ